MIRTSLEQLNQLEIGHLYGMNDTTANYTFDTVTTDSREATDHSIFVAIAGEHCDGHDFVHTLHGEVLAVVDHVIEGVDIPQLVVDDTIRALGDIARANIEKRRMLARRGVHEFSIIGITGSVGKTTTKDMLHAVLSHIAPTVAPVGSFNNNIGLPLTALKVNEKTRFLVAEMGASAQGEIAYLTTITPPDISIVLKVGVAHLGGFGSVEGIRDAKAEIVKALTSSGVAILNADDAYVRTMADMTKASSIIWFSRHNEHDQPKPQTSAMISSVIVRGTDTNVDELNRAQFSVSLPDGQHFALRLGLSGEHNVFNALAVLSAIYSLDIPEHIAATVLSSMTNMSPHRMHISRVNKNDTHFTVIDDSFNANPDSMRAGLKALATYQGRIDSEHTSVDNTICIAKVDSIENTDSIADNSHETHCSENHCSDSEHDQIDKLVSTGTPYHASPSCSSHALLRIAVLGSMLELGPTEEEAHRHIGAYATQCADVVIAVGSEHDENLSRLAHCLADGACAESNGQNDGSSVYYVDSTHEADSIVTSFARQHRCVVLLKGSHASGLSALASQWIQ